MPPLQWMFVSCKTPKAISMKHQKKKKEKKEKSMKNYPANF